MGVTYWDDRRGSAVARSMTEKKKDPCQVATDRKPSSLDGDEATRRRQCRERDAWSLRPAAVAPVALRRYRPRGRARGVRAQAGERPPAGPLRTLEQCSAGTKTIVDSRRDIWPFQDRTGIALCAVDMSDRPGEIRLAQAGPGVWTGDRTLELARAPRIRVAMLFALSGRWKDRRRRLNPRGGSD